MLDAAIADGEKIVKGVIDASVKILRGEQQEAWNTLAPAVDHISALNASCRRVTLRRGQGDPLVIALTKYQTSVIAFCRYVVDFSGPDDPYDDDEANVKMRAASSAHDQMIQVAMPLVRVKDLD